jgi:replication initiation and membrane attachment protein DnaB
MFTRPELTDFRADFDKAVKDLSKQYNVTIQLKTISFARDEFHTKMVVNRLGAEGKPVNKDREYFLSLAEFYGLSKLDLGKVIVHAGKTYTISGLNPKATKNLIILTTSNGKSVSGSVALVKRCLGVK